jgi:hypothetical protein
MSSVNWRFYISFVSAVEGRVRGDLQAAMVIKAEIEEILTEGFFQRAPFDRLGLIVVFGTRTDLNPSYRALNKGELPITVQVEMERIRKFRGEALVEALREIVLEALIRVARRYGLPTAELIKRRLSAPEFIVPLKESAAMDEIVSSSAPVPHEISPQNGEAEMAVDQFWSLIEKSSRNSLNCDQQTDSLVRLLERLSPKKIIGFNQRFYDMLKLANRWDLWAVAEIIYDGCSDDAFEDFRAWLLSMGRARFELALTSPQTVADLLVPGRDPECEALLYAAQRAYQNTIGESLPEPDYDPLAHPQGQPWKREDLKYLYPNLWRRFNPE